MYKWKVFCSPFRNANHVFPTQQQDVATIVRVCAGSLGLHRIVIFGSSVTPLCNPWSDIDVYFEAEDGWIPPVFDTVAAVDCWTTATVDRELLDEIFRTGVIVYEVGDPIGASIQ